MLGSSNLGPGLSKIEVIAAIEVLYMLLHPVAAIYTRGCTTTEWLQVLHCLARMNST